jgi:hypothetical protein
MSKRILVVDGQEDLTRISEAQPGRLESSSYPLRSRVPMISRPHTKSSRDNDQTL